MKCKFVVWESKFVECGMGIDLLQVGIPVDAEKINTKTTEEVTLPPSAPHKPIVAEKILISQLDNVAKLVFAKTKRLNEVCKSVTMYGTQSTLDVKKTKPSWKHKFYQPVA